MPLFCLTSCCTSVFISMNCKQRLNQMGWDVLVSVSSVLSHLLALMQHINHFCGLLFPNHDSFFTTGIHFTGGLPFIWGYVCFIWTHHRPFWLQIMLREEVQDRINCYRGRGKYLLRSVKAFANRGDPSRAFKMSHPCLVHLHNL